MEKYRFSAAWNPSFSMINGAWGGFGADSGAGRAGPGKIGGREGKQASCPAVA
jgi:hypothetical protein